jgi:hypothetical protein
VGEEGRASGGGGAAEDGRRAELGPPELHGGARVGLGLFDCHCDTMVW